MAIIAFEDTYVSEKGMEKLFQQMDDDRDGKVCEKELKGYIMKKEELRNKHQKQENDRKGGRIKEATEKIEERVKSIFAKLGNNYCLY